MEGDSWFVVAWLDFAGDCFCVDAFNLVPNNPIAFTDEDVRRGLDECGVDGFGGELRDPVIPARSFESIHELFAF